MAYTQTDRRIAISTPLGKDVLLLRGFTGSEGDLAALSFRSGPALGKRLHQVSGRCRKKRHAANLRCETAGALLERIHQPVLPRRAGPPAHCVPRRDGALAVVSYAQRGLPYFSEYDVPDIIQKIFKDLASAISRVPSTAAYDPRDYCVQYRETDFNFVSRLMEKLGSSISFSTRTANILWCWRTIPRLTSPAPDQGTARFDFAGVERPGVEDVITELQLGQENADREVVPDGLQLRDPQHQPGRDRERQESLRDL